MDRWMTMSVMAAATLMSGCGPWPFGDVCNQEYRILFAYELGTATAKQCDTTSDGWDDDAWPGYADYHDRQDDPEFDELYLDIPVSIDLLLHGDGDMGIAACMDRDPLWDILDFAREEPWLEPEFNEGDLWDAGHDEFRAYWSQDCAEFWQLEFDFRCWQLDTGTLPRSIQVLDEDFDRCSARPDLGVDWESQL